ncbi:MAG: alanine--tRNA ligase [Candidatus Kapaibacteriales bacterium]
MTSAEIRRQFISFFKERGHQEVDSAPVVPYDDPTLLFTNAGMNQFKDVFLGTGTRNYTKAVDSQKCIRVSGKHNDLEAVGVDHYHHTFFEMLGNWSFGDYYKKEAIAYAWELLTEVWKLDKDRLYITVYETDEEAYQLWQEHVSADRILKFGEKDNFWEMGDTGPCGPSSEIHYDGTSDKSGKSLVNADSEEVIEIWNLVFIQYNREENGNLVELNKTHVDTGMGFERITRLLQGKSSNYDTDIFSPIIEKISSFSNIAYQGTQSEQDIAFRVIADHIRPLAFSIADGALPGNDGRGYVLRRILRRASRYAGKLGFNEPILYKLVPTLIELYGNFFPELSDRKELIEKIILSEEESFLATLQSGLDRLNSILETEGKVSASNAFQLYDTFGFPLDLTVLVAKENNAQVDELGFKNLMLEQKERSRSSSKVKSQDITDIDSDLTTEFVGYESSEVSPKVIWSENNKVITSFSPFYAEKGGQISDTGILSVNSKKTYKIIDVKQIKDAIVHILDREFEEGNNTEVTLSIDSQKRNAIRKNHSATHLLHEELKRTLGDHITQQGSLVSDSYLRFDYNHFEKPSISELSKIENSINLMISKGGEVKTDLLTIDQAKNDKSIKQLFGEKYGDTVRAVRMGDDQNQFFSSELCGGTHVKDIGEIGVFAITSESSVSSGVRRIEAVTGYEAYNFILEQKNKLKEKNKEIDSLKSELSSLQKTIKKLSVQDSTSEVDNAVKKSKKVNDINIATLQIDDLDGEQLREISDTLRSKLSKSGIGLLASITEDSKILLACVVTDDLIKQYPAGKLVGLAAKTVGGGGGGKPHMATAGGRDINNLENLLNNLFYNIVRDYI